MPRGREVDFTSRGDPLRAELWLPESSDPDRVPPLVWVTPPLGDPHGGEAAQRLCDRIAAAGMAAAWFDLPLHGSRASRKLSDPLRAAARAASPTAAQGQLLAAYREQLLADLDAGCRALLEHPALRGARLGCLALDPGGEAAHAWAEKRGDVPCVRFGGAEDADAFDVESMVGMLRR